MSKVQFIQWGTDVSPKKFTDRWAVDEQNKPTGPSTSFSELLAAYTGGVIFVTYKDAKDKDLVQEIWANGVQYSVGGGGGNIIYGTTAPDADGIVTVEDNTVTGSEGYIYIYTQANGLQTAYYWNVNKWSAFEVEAEHVWFPDGVLRTERWGSAVTENSTPTAECVGKNLKEVMEYYLVKEKFTKSTITRANTTAPSFTGALTTTPTLEVDSYILLNAEKDIVGTYYPTVSKSSNCVQSGNLTFGPQTINNSTGYKLTTTDTTYTAGNKFGDSIVVTADVGDIVQGSGTVVVRVGTVDKASANYTASDTSKQVTWSVDTTKLGEYTASLVATNSTSCSATYKQGDTSVEYVNIPAIATIYPVTNKGNIPTTAQFGAEAQPNGISATAYRVPQSGSFPTSMTFTASPSTTASYTVYLPIVGNMASGAALGSSSRELTKFYKYSSNKFTMTGYISGTNPGEGNSSRYYLEFPSTYLSLASISDGQSTLTKDTHYTVQSSTTTYGGVSYSKITLLPGYKHANVTNKALTFTFNKPAN